MRVLRTVAMGALLGAFAFNASGAGCYPQSDFQCVTDMDCIGQGAGGLCEPNSFCSFPDAACTATGRRWDDRAAESLAGDCMEGLLDTDTDMMTSSSSGDTSSSSEAGNEESSTTMPVDPVTSTTDPATTDMSAGSSSGSGSETAAPGACDMMYGGATDYMLCEETADSCRFSVTIGMAMSCTDVCTSFGGTCVGAELNDVEFCTSTGAGTCEQIDVNDIICICSL